MAELGSRRPVFINGIWRPKWREVRRGGGNTHRDQRPCSLRNHHGRRFAGSNPALSVPSNRPGPERRDRDGTVAHDAGPKRCCLTTMTGTTYTVRTSGGTYQTTDADRAERESKNGAVVTAVAHA